MVEEGQPEEGLAQLQGGIRFWRAKGAEHFVPFFLALQAEAFLRLDNLPDGIAAVVEARGFADKGGDRYWMAEVERLHGELLRAHGESRERVEAHFRQALGIARQQEARMLELRAATSLARLWQSQGRIHAARQLVAGVYGQFDEGFATPDLQEAVHLINALS